MQIFVKWSYYYLQKLYLNTSIKKYGLNQTIYKIGEEAENVYFLKSGEIKVLMKYIKYQI